MHQLLLKTQRFLHFLCDGSCGNQREQLSNADKMLDSARDLGPEFIATQRAEMCECQKKIATQRAEKCECQKKIATQRAEKCECQKKIAT